MRTSSDLVKAAEQDFVGIEGIGTRIADIQSQIMALEGRSPVVAPVAAEDDGFAGHLARAAVTAPAGRVAALTGQAYAVNAHGIPVSLAAYGNGHIPPEALEQVGDTRHRLWAPAAEALTRMIGDARTDGVTIGINDSYRTYAEQVDLAHRKGLYSQGGLAARPGTSEHGWGMAADLDLDPAALSWMRQHAGNYGYVNNVARESWHWAYKPASV